MPPFTSGRMPAATLRARGMARQSGFASAIDAGDLSPQTKNGARRPHAALHFHPNNSAKLPIRIGSYPTERSTDPRTRGKQQQADLTTIPIGRNVVKTCDAMTRFARGVFRVRGSADANELNRRASHRFLRHDERSRSVSVASSQKQKTRQKLTNVSLW